MPVWMLQRSSLKRFCTPTLNITSHKQAKRNSLPSEIVFSFPGCLHHSLLYFIKNSFTKCTSKIYAPLLTSFSSTWTRHSAFLWSLPQFHLSLVFDILFKIWDTVRLVNCLKLWNAQYPTTPFCDFFYYCLYSFNSISNIFSLYIIYVLYVYNLLTGEWFNSLSLNT